MQATTATARSNTLTALDRTSAARPVPEKSFPCCTASQGVSPPAPAAGGNYPGYPLVAGRQVALLWFFVGLPLCIALAGGGVDVYPNQSQHDQEGGSPMKMIRYLRVIAASALCLTTLVPPVAAEQLI